MFYALCAALCLAALFVVLGAAVALSLPMTDAIRRLANRATASGAADVILGFRLAPFLLAVIVSLGLAFPAFLEFEPRSTREMLQWPLVSLAICGVAVLLVMFRRSAAMLRATWSLQRNWAADSIRLDIADVHCPIYCVKHATSLLAVTGILRTRVFASADIVEALSPQELAAALRHEMAHLRSLDNLKQLLLRSMELPFSSFRSMDRAWVSASEIAADEDAVRTGASALELSSALVKVGRLSSAVISPSRLAASHLAPYGCGASTATRAAHLSELLRQEPASKPDRRSALLSAGLLLLALYFISLSALLPVVHDAMEWMVR